jgi:hypothetical protein
MRYGAMTMTHFNEEDKEEIREFIKDMLDEDHEILELLR